jgi:hypothetical protein
MAEASAPIRRTPSWYAKWLFATVLLTLVAMGGLFGLSTPIFGGLLFDWWFSPSGGVTTLGVAAAVGAWLWSRLLG